jgi:GTPase SAR1 family protein
MDQRIQVCAEAILSVRNNQKLMPEVIEQLRFLWENEIIQSMYAMRNEICVPDSTQYFFDHLDRVTADDYMPNDRDLILVRYRTTGMQEKKFQIEGHPFVICDVGGQRNERRKWIHFFNNVTSVIFVVSLSCYDELTFESETNAMAESMDVFREHMNSKWFAEMDFILFLNKSDLYFSKITRVPLTAAPCFASYSGTPHDPQQGLAYIKAQFKSLNASTDRSFFQHVTCATDRGQIEKVFNDVQTMIINWSLAKAGLT